VCRLGRCRVDCANDRDCAAGARCVFGAESAGACTIASEATCTSDSCASGLVCTSAGCRDACTDVCRGGNVCQAGICLPGDTDAGVIGDAGTAGAILCAHTSDCTAPRICVDTDLISICEMPCTTGADCSGDVDCAAMPETGGGPDRLVCGVDCDPITDEGCPIGTHCSFDDFVNGYASFCRGVDATAMGEGCACGDGNESIDCAPGLVCGRDRAQIIGRCVHVCTATTACPDGSTCFFPPRAFTRGGVAFGYCDVGATPACP
jgi:hypothetical protein